MLEAQAQKGQVKSPKLQDLKTATRDQLGALDPLNLHSYPSETYLPTEMNYEIK